MITATIKHTTQDRETNLKGKDIDEIIEKIKDFHVLTDFEVSYFTKKGKARLDEERNSGWYIDGGYLYEYKPSDTRRMGCFTKVN